MNRSLLYVTVLVIATCGLIYELIVGTLASYLLGDSITQFSTVIGVYLFALGIGAWLSGFIDKGVAQRFVEIELAVALAGGISAPFLFATFAAGASFRVALYGMVLVIGTLVGLEIPLLMRIMKEQLQFKGNRHLLHLTGGKIVVEVSGARRNGRLRNRLRGPRKHRPVRISRGVVLARLQLLEGRHAAPSIHRHVLLQQIRRAARGGVEWRLLRIAAHPQMRRRE